MCALMFTPFTDGGGALLIYLCLADAVPRPDGKILLLLTAQARRGYVTRIGLYYIVNGLYTEYVELFRSWPTVPKARSDVCLRLINATYREV